MATRLPLVIVNGQFEQLQPGDSLDIRADQFQMTNDEATAVVIGAPVYNDANAGVKRAQANALSSSKVVGLVGQAPSIANGTPGSITLDGVLTATTTQWDAVTGQTGGLTFGTIYYLDPATPGKLTTTAPVTPGQVVIQIGQAISATDFKVNIQQSVLL